MLYKWVQNLPWFHEIKWKNLKIKANFHRKTKCLIFFGHWVAVKWNFWWRYIFFYLQRIKFKLHHRLTYFIFLGEYRMRNLELIIVFFFSWKKSNCTVQIKQAWKYISSAKTPPLSFTKNPKCFKEISSSWYISKNFIFFCSALPSLLWNWQHREIFQGTKYENSANIKKMGMGTGHR